MRGYKGMDAHMRCRGMQYEIGKTYRIDGKLVVCKNGLHFCKNLIDVFEYYPRENGNRFFEVEAIGDVQSEGDKSAALELKVVREVAAAELNRCYHGCGYGYGAGYVYYGAGYYGNGYYGTNYGAGYYWDGAGTGEGNGNIQKILLFK